ncbi:leukemia inhibitory factor receptor isoform X3 [Pungitius pungitius]|uniref:leukemia inhibitory factor receptor isoform X3 n=1 Tax=Pungitius pungitius TaxID=134920 RepID=UPI002E14F6C3
MSVSVRLKQHQFEIYAPLFVQRPPPTCRKPAHCLRLVGLSVCARAAAVTLILPYALKGMQRFTTPFIYLLWLHLICSMDHRGSCSVLQPPMASIGPLQADSDGLSLSLSWRVNHSDSARHVYEIQILRAGSHAVVYDRNLSLPPVESDAYKWTWTSDVPLKCVDHSARVRQFYNRSVPSPWSNWVTNYGALAQDKTQIFPSQEVLRENTSAVFCCLPKRRDNVTKMTFNNREYPLLGFGASRVKAITVHNLSIPKTFIKRHAVSCSNARGQIGHTFNYVSFPPQKPRNLRCAISDMVNVVCRWDPGRWRDLYDRNKQIHTLHVDNWDQGPVVCAWSSCTFPAAPQREHYNISVVVKNQLGEETESYSFNVSDRVFPLVEVVRVSPDVSHAIVSWAVRGDLTRLDFFCQVATEPGSITWRSCKSGLCQVRLEHLLPNSCYSMRVRCSSSRTFWGDWTQPVSFTTYPMVTLDVWRRIKRLSDPNTRQVTLLWTVHVPGSAAPVNIQGYVVQWSQGGQNQTESKGGGHTWAEVILDAGQHDITVQAVVTGYAVPAHITVPRSDDEGTVPATKRLSSNAAAGFNLSWRHADSATCGYTVEWCILGCALPCTTVQWLKVPEGNNTLVLSPRFVKSPRLIEPVQRTSSSVMLEWSYSEDDPAHPGFITGYLVTAQEVGAGGCNDPFNVSVADPGRKSVSVDGLQQNQEYVFSVSALTEGGPGEPTRVTIRTSTNYSTPLAKILPPVLLLLGCAVLAWPQRKMLKQIFAYPAGMNINPPELDSFLFETAERLQAQEVEQCSSCAVEVLITTPPVGGPEPRPGSLPRPPLHTDYCPQSVTVLLDRPVRQSITNETYLLTRDTFCESQNF